MKGLFTGLVLGAIATWCWYQTGGKISITETKTTTNEVFKTVNETQIVEQLAYQYITKTNEVWKTNMVEKIVQAAAVAPVAQKAVEQLKTVQPIVQQAMPAPATSPSVGFSDSRPASTVSQPARRKIVNINAGSKVKRNLDGSVKQTGGNQ
jgi:hypothetical protein